MLKTLSIILTFLFCFSQLSAQCVLDPATGMLINLDGTPCINALTSGAPFLDLNIGASEMALGNVKVVAPENSGLVYTGQNPALLSRDSRYIEMSLQYSPWISPEEGTTFSFLQASVQAKWRPKSEWGLIAKRFSSKQSLLVGGTSLVEVRPQDLSLQLNYATGFGKGWTLGVGATYLESNSDLSTLLFLENTFEINLTGTIGLKYQKAVSRANGTVRLLQWGFSIANVGPKIDFSNNAAFIRHPGDYMPASIQTGLLLAHSANLSPNRRWNVRAMYQLQKLLVPTPCWCDENFNFVPDDKEKNWWEGMVQSFNDAPGGALEEWREILHQLGFEFQFDLQPDLSVTARGGYHYQHELKGGQQYVTTGLGLRFRELHLAAAYWLSQQEALDGTFAVQIGFQKFLEP